MIDVFTFCNDVSFVVISVILVGEHASVRWFKIASCGKFDVAQFCLFILVSRILGAVLQESKDLVHASFFC